MQFGVLGPLAAWKGTRELPLGGAKQKGVLAILLLKANELVPTPTLVDELWGEHPPPTAIKAVQVHISRLRKLLGQGILETRSTGYLLRVAPSELDAARFEQLLDKGGELLAHGRAEEAARVLRESLALWRGPPLADFRYEEFATNETGRLEELRMVAVERRLEAELALGHAADVVGELEALVRDHPLRERPYGLLILALYRTGRQADALRVYHEARKRLHDELGLDPSASLQQLERAILVQDPSLDLATPSAPHARHLSAQAPPAPEGQAPFVGRKVVTVLFCDVVAYTELGDRLDPESLRAVLSRHFDRAAAVIERYGGTVEKFVGDEVMAIFGVPVVREDDALRAVRAAFALREPVEEVDAGTDLEVRIGVNTGEVFAGDPSGGRGFVTGDPVSVGKRLEQAAAPGEIVIGEETFALVAHAVEAERLGPLSLKGKKQGVTAYRLTSVDPIATAIPRRYDSLLVDRVDELDRLRAIYVEVATRGGARLITIVGEPGIGKSRLVRAFTSEIDGESTVLVGRCPPYGEGITFWPLREMLRHAGRDESVLESSSHEVFPAARRIFEEIAAERPLVAVFDDVHWAEPTFLDFIEYMAGRLGSAGVLLLCLTRPQLVERRPNWLQEPATPLLLQPLSDADSEAMLEALGTPSAVRPQIARAAEGNPLFVEQLAAIADEQSLPGDMPGSIRGVVHERLDRLSHGERATLERASVAGRSFTLDTVLDLTPEEERESVHPHLLGLVRARLVHPDTASPEEGFRFHHALIRDATYDSIPKGMRASLHERVAERLQTTSADDAVIGFHLEQAYELRHELGEPDPELAARAGRMLRRAGLAAFANTDLPATVSLLERSRSLLPVDEAIELLPDLGEALFEAGRFADAADVLDEALEGAAGDPLLDARARVEQQFVRAHFEASDLQEAKRVAQEASLLCEQHGDDLGQCRASSLSAWVDWNQGRCTAADEAWKRAAVHARAAGEQRALFKVLTWRASAACEGPTPVPEAIRMCNEFRDEVESDPVSVAVILNPLAALHAMVGEFDEARALTREGSRILSDVGRMQSAVDHHEALVHTLAGEPAVAADLLRTGYERLEHMGEKSLLSTTAAMLAQAVYAQGLYGEADLYCGVSEATAAHDDLLSQTIWRGVRSKLLARQGEFQEAEGLAAEAVGLIARTDLLSHHGEALLDLAEVLRLADRQAKADEAAHAALELYQRKGNVVGAGLARSLVAAPAST